MGELVDRDLEHLNLLKLCFYIQAGVTGFFSLFSLLYMALGAWITSSALDVTAGLGDNSHLIGLIFLTISILFLVLGISGAIVSYYVGRCLVERRRRTFCIVVAALGCIQIPYGTAIGICTISVLNRPGVKALFDAPR